MRRSRQVIRLLGLLKALQDGECLHVAQLAARFHVRRETVYRDLRALEELGFPVVGDIHGVKSRPRLASRSSPKSVSIPFTLSELLALAFAASAAALPRATIGWADDARLEPGRPYPHPGPRMGGSRLIGVAKVRRVAREAGFWEVFRPRTTVIRA